MNDATGEHHISSAVVSVLPGHEAAVAEAVAALPDTEVHHAEDGKIVIVMEGASTGALGERLAGIALMDHVMSANMVYEVVDRETAATKTEPGSQGGDP